MFELVKPEDCFLWKIAYLPPLETWVSRSGKVVLLGDAAHAMVPHLGMVYVISIHSPFYSFRSLHLKPIPD
jgi:hypothetical protein